MVVQMAAWLGFSMAHIYLRAGTQAYRYARSLQMAMGHLEAA